MYRKHFALTRHPFGQEIAPDELFLSASTRELDVRLAHLLDLRGIGLVTGDSGSGKTCACRRVLTQLHTGLYRVLYVSLSTGNVMDLLKTISWEMGLSVERSRAALYRQIKSEVSRLCGDARTRPSSSSMRPITSAPMCSKTSACSPTTRWTPSPASACSCSARPNCDGASPWRCTRPSPSASSSATTWPPLTREECTGYLAHRLRLATAETPLFDPTAEEAIYQATGGLPRKINLLAHHTLMAAALARAKLATADHVQAALPEVA